MSSMRSLLNRWASAIRTRTVAFIAIIMAVAVTAISCSSSSGPAATEVAQHLALHLIWLPTISILFWLLTGLLTPSMWSTE